MTPPLLVSPPDRLGDWFADHGTAVLGTLVLAAIAIILIRTLIPRAMRPAIARQMAGRTAAEIDRRTQTLASVIVRTGEVVIIALALFTVLPEFGFDIRAVLAGVSITSIAIGLGAQSLVKDALNGIFILTENQYAVGDVVTIAGVTGTVEDITLRRTVIRDIDGVVHFVPNGAITTASNLTRDYANVRVNVPVSPAADFERVRAVIDATGRALADDPAYRAMITRAPQFIRIENIDAMAGATVQVAGSVVAGTQWQVAGALRERLIEAFRREGIKTPWG
jgi:small conductance mechanosensitive channel